MHYHDQDISSTSFQRMGYTAGNRPLARSLRPLCRDENRMSKIAKSTDLTKLEGDPQARAEAYMLLEQCDVEVTLPALLGGGSLKISTRTRSGSAMVTSIAVFLLVVAG